MYNFHNVARNDNVYILPGKRIQEPVFVLFVVHLSKPTTCTYILGPFMYNFHNVARNTTFTFYQETRAGPRFFCLSSLAEVSPPNPPNPSPWNNRNGWLGVKHQVTYLLTPPTLHPHPTVRHVSTHSPFYRCTSCSCVSQTVQPLTPLVDITKNCWNETLQECPHACTHTWRERRIFFNCNQYQRQIF